MIEDILITIKTMLYQNNIPTELHNTILYKQGGIQHPIAENIQLYWDYMRDEQNAFEKVSLVNDGKTINSKQTTLDYPVLHFPIIFNLGVFLED